MSKFEFTNHLTYPDLVSRTSDSGSREYDTPYGPAASVTTILSTLPNPGIDAWRERVGEEEADRVSKEATVIGSAMHDMLENYVIGTTHEFPDTPEVSMAKKMFKMVRMTGLTKVEKVIGVEVALYLFNLYAGRTDLICVYDGIPTVLDYKGLPIDTPLPTPNGWTTMGEVKEGDTIFGGDGSVCTITGKSQQKILPCYKITFSNKSSVVCDEEHLWKLHDGQIVTAPELKMSTGKGEGKEANKIPISQAAQYGEKDLLIDPYVLGAWLADGAASMPTITKPDAGIWEEIQSRGYEISKNYSRHSGKCRAHCIYDLRPHLRSYELLNNKHIPEIYMQSSITQRLDLLRGIMDGDGSYNKTRSQAVLNTVDKEFAEQVLELAQSLGQNPYISPHTAHDFGLEVQAYFVQWRPRIYNPFCLSRKADLVDLDKTGHSGWLKIKTIEELPAQPTQCIAVDSVDNTYLCTKNYIVTHNSSRGLKPTDYLDHYKLQCAMYTIAHNIMFPEENLVQGVLIIGVRPNYQYKIAPRIQKVIIGYDELADNQFKALDIVYNFHNERDTLTDDMLDRFEFVLDHLEKTL